MNHSPHNLSKTPYCLQILNDDMQKSRKTFERTKENSQ